MKNSNTIVNLKAAKQLVKNNYRIANATYRNIKKNKKKNFRRLL